MTEDRTATVAAPLLRAWQGGPPADDAAVRELVASPEEAYAIQDRVLAGLGEPAGVARHWKSGAATAAGPFLHAPLPSRGVLPSGAGTKELVLRHHWIEAEVALRTGCSVSPEVAQGLRAPQQAHALVDAMCVSIEIVDSRWAAARAAPPLLKLADFLVHGALVLGEFVPFEAVRAWDQQVCRVRIGRGDWQEFRGSLGIGDPAAVLPQWLRHATRHGDAVPPGTVVTTGTWCGLLEATAGDVVEAAFPGVGAARVRL